MAVSVLPAPIRALQVAVDDGVATLTLRHPPVNALTPPLISALAATIRRLARASEVRAIVLVGGIRNAFCSGGDVGELFGRDMRRSSETARLQLALDMQRAFRSIERCPRPLVAAINGVTIGAGLELALVCDLRVASELACFALPELRHHIIPCLGGTQRLASIVGLGRAKELLMLGRRLRADDAIAWGLVHRLAPHRAVLATAQALARELAAKPPHAFGALKRAIQRGPHRVSARAFAAESKAFWHLVNRRLAETEDGLG